MVMQMFYNNHADCLGAELKEIQGDPESFERLTEKALEDYEIIGGALTAVVFRTMGGMGRPIKLPGNILVGRGNGCTHCALIIW